MKRIGVVSLEDTATAASTFSNRPPDGSAASTGRPDPPKGYRLLEAPTVAGIFFWQ